MIAYIWMAFIVGWAIAGFCLAWGLPPRYTGWLFLWLFGGIAVIFALGHVLPVIFAPLA